MKGGIICKEKNMNAYENRRFKEVAQEEGIELEFHDLSVHTCAFGAFHMMLK